MCSVRTDAIGRKQRNQITRAMQHAVNKSINPSCGLIWTTGASRVPKKHSIPMKIVAYITQFR